MPVLLAATGVPYFAAALYLVLARVRLGTLPFFIVAAVMAVAFSLMLSRVWSRPAAPRHLLFAALALAAAFRLPPTIVDVGHRSDMVRYVWDGRVQLLGYNPYLVVPADPRLAYTHTEQTAAMPSARMRTPYPPAAQLFFRLVVSIRDSTLAMKVALVACDLLTVLVLWRWLVSTGRNEWLVLAYAWHPLVVLEIAHSGHVDALVALWITAAAYWLTRGRGMLATVAFVLAVMTKPLPVVLAPLFLGRVRVRDILAGIAVAVALFLPFLSRTELPLGLMPGVVQYFRFNAPIYRLIAWLTVPALAAALAVGAGLAVAFAARRHLSISRPEAWAWPMAVALVLGPVVYPWYLLSVVPFLFSWRTLPIMAWTFSVLPVYVVWQNVDAGVRWAVPPALLVLEYAVVAGVGLVVYRRARRYTTKDELA